MKLLAFLIIALFSLPAWSMSDPPSGIGEEAARREKELNQKIKTVFGELGYEKEVKVSDLYSYPWTYMCWIGGMSNGARLIPREDRATINQILSKDKYLGDNDEGLTFYNKEDRSLMTLSVDYGTTGYEVSFTYEDKKQPPCVERENAYVALFAPARPDFPPYLRFFSNP